MKALGVTLALGCAVVCLPATARAESIGAHVGKLACTVDSYPSTEPGEHTGGSRRVVAVNVASNNEEGNNDNDVTFTPRSGLEHSAHFADHGSSESFADDRISFGDQIASDGFGADLRRAITMALRADNRGPGGGHGDGEDNGRGRGRGEGGDHGKGRDEGGRGLLVPRADATASPNPEPASMLLIGTGLAGLFRYRRQLFV